MKTRSLISATVTCAVFAFGLSAPAGAAEPAYSAGNAVGMGDTVKSDMPADQIDPDSVAGQVNDAHSREEAINILESNGFKESGAGSGIYEKTEAGLTIGFDVNEGVEATLPPEPGMATAQWATVWRGVTPYIRGSIDEWQVAAEDGLTVGSAACALITNVYGAAGCVAVAGVAANWVGRYDTSAWPRDMCLAITPLNTTPKTFVESCV